jgi:hypothetical protein
LSNVRESRQFAGVRVVSVQEPVSSLSIFSRCRDVQPEVERGLADRLQPHWRSFRGNGATLTEYHRESVVNTDQARIPQGYEKAFKNREELPHIRFFICNSTGPFR